MKKSNKAWAERIIRRIDPSYRYRWETFNQFILSHLSKDAIWLDIGCGDNSIIEDFGERARYAIGIDWKISGNKANAPFICADLYHLPLYSGIADLVTMRFVVEHLQNIPDKFSEIERVLKSNAHFVIITTNIWSPFIFLSHLLPYYFKKKIIRFLYRTDDIHPTFHKFNSPKKMKRGVGNLKLIYFDFVQDVNYIRRWIFLIFFSWHLLTKSELLKSMRTCIIAVFEKSSSSVM